MTTMGRAQAKGRACGKVILLGEHAVVYGVPAIAVGIDRGAQASVTPLGEGPSRLRVLNWDIEVSESELDRDLGRAFADVLAASRTTSSARAFPLWAGPVQVEAQADLPPGAGLGCSAAISVAIVRALDPRATVVEVFERATAWERVFHGNPSGIDAAAAASGGCILFERGLPPTPLRMRGGLVLCVGHSGTASSTKTMVEAVAEYRRMYPRKVDGTFEEIRMLVEQARPALETGDRALLGRLMDQNQVLLAGLELSNASIRRMCECAIGAGALGAKLTGAGGGGCVVALAGSLLEAERVIEAWKREQFDGFITHVEAPAELSPFVREVAS